MKVPGRWLKEYIDLKLPSAEIARILTSLGLEVDGVEETPFGEVYEISFTPNLGHCMNMIGVARELSAATGEAVKTPKITLSEQGEPIEKLIAVRVEDPKRCQRYACRYVQNIQVKPSPKWLQDHLEAAGIRSINNIVDITNFVLLETGQPLHAFDADKLAKKQINIRSAKEGEPFTTLDGKERVLKEGDLLIADGEKGIAIAGVMGGQNSEVTDQTRNIVIESASFQPKSIRRTSKHLALQTDSSKRFERSCDPNGVLQALNRAAALMQELGGGMIAKGVIDQKPHDFPDRQIACRLSRLNGLLGTQFGLNEVESLFQRLSFKTSWDGQDTLTVTVPTYRADVTTEIDLIEEAARIYGYDNIERATVKYQGTRIPHHPIYLFERKVRSHLIAEGLQEFLTCDLIGPAGMELVREKPEDAVHVLNPVSIEQSILRTSLLPGLLQTIKFNWDHQNGSISAFEVGKIHFKSGEHYKEQNVVGIVLTGKKTPYHWDPKPIEVDFFDLKGIVENLLRELGVQGFTFKESKLPNFHTGRQASIYVGDLKVGSLGEIHPAIQRKLDVPQRLLFAELNLHDLYPLERKVAKMEKVAIYPASERDWTVTLPEELPIETILNQLKSVHSPYLESVTLVDIYRNPKLGEKVKNATFNFVYRDSHKTIDQETVEKEHQRIIQKGSPHV